ncbi:MAG: serpin family protein [Actinomycetota bacterium]|nr:serpin family protein [Actinomycetota bacterium]
MLTSRLLALLLAIVLLVACGPPTAPQGDGDLDPGGNAAMTTRDVEAVADSLSDADAREVAGGVNALGFALLEQLAAAAPPGENIVISPLSAAVLLALLRTGAGESAGAAISQVLGQEPEADEEAAPAFAALLYRLRDPDDVELAVANALFAAPGYPLEPSFVERAGRSFEATLENTDLGAQEGADRIDEWVTAETEGLITEFAHQLGLPDPRAVLVLLNAVYFKGIWTTQFDPDRTDEDGTFAREDGTPITVPLMHEQDLRAGYRRGEHGTVGRLPYGDQERYAMEILLPPDGASLREAITDLDAGAWARLTADLPEPTIPVWLPRFDSEWESSLDDALKALGMAPAYRNDYAPMSPRQPFLSTIQQKTFIRVDEEGTEAAAVTGGVMTESKQADPDELRVDRPFLFTITDAETGTILFLGAIADPTA